MGIVTQSLAKRGLAGGDRVGHAPAMEIVPIKLGATRMVDLNDTTQRLSLMAAGERALALYGVNGMSLQSIALDAGNRNKFAVQYHFGTKLAFIEAIIAARRAELNRRRNELLVEAMADGRSLNLQILLEALHLPLAEQVGANGEQFFARILLQILAGSGEWGNVPRMIGINDPGNPTTRIWKMVSEHMGFTGEPDRNLKLAVAMKIVPAYLVDWETMRLAGKSCLSREEAVMQGVQMCVAALQTP